MNTRKSMFGGQDISQDISMTIVKINKKQQPNLDRMTSDTNPSGMKNESPCQVKKSPKQDSLRCSPKAKKMQNSDRRT